MSCFETYFSADVMLATGELHILSLGGLRWYLLALCVVILNQVLEEVHSFLGLDLIYFDQVLQSKERCRVQPGVEIQGVFKGLNEVECGSIEKRLQLCRRHLKYEHFAL